MSRRDDPGLGAGDAAPLRAASHWMLPPRRHLLRHALLLQGDPVADAGHSRAPQDPPLQHADFAAWCESHPGSVCDLWLGGMLVHDWLCDMDTPLAGDAALIAYARKVFVHYHGPAAQHWPLAAWSARGQQGVSALHGIDLPALIASARRHGVRVQHVRPWWSRVLAGALGTRHALRSAPTAWLLVVERDFVGALRLHHGRLMAVVPSWLEAPTPAALEALAHSLCGGDTSPAPVPIAALGYGLDGEPGSPVLSLAPLASAVPGARWLLAPGSGR